MKIFGYSAEELCAFFLNFSDELFERYDTIGAVIRRAMLEESYYVVFYKILELRVVP